MPRWISITEDDLNDAKLVPLVKALREQVLAPGQTDPLPRLTQTVVDEIRRKVASCRNNRLDSDTTKIPASLKQLAVDKIYGALAGRLQEALTDDEVRLIATHDRNLDRIASCTDTIEQPDDPIEAPVESGSPSPSVTTCRREQLNRRKGL